MRGMKRAVSIAAAGVGWAGLILESVGMLPAPMEHLGRLAAVLAVAGTIRLMLWAHQRPIARVYELGYEMGRRDQMKDANRDAKSSIAVVRHLFADRPAAND